MKKVFILFALPFFASCELSVVQLPCIFGEWTVFQVQTLDGQAVKSFNVNDDLMLKPRAVINFQKNDEAIIRFSDSTSQTLRFRFSSEGFRFLTETEEIWAKDIKVGKDTLMLQLNNILVLMERPKVN